jgi:hypothetical protein
MEVADTVEENGENPKNNKDQQGEVEQAAGKGEMTEDDLMKLAPPVSAMIQGEGPIHSWFSIDCRRKFKIRIQQRSSEGQKAFEILLSAQRAVV